MFAVIEGRSVASAPVIRLIFFGWNGFLTGRQDRPLKLRA
jgi:hypothetical protein